MLIPLKRVDPEFAAGLLGRHVPEGVIIVVGEGEVGAVGEVGLTGAAPGTH